jgi:serine phosphatase RsbU (regulator of sigma subunit)
MTVAGDKSSTQEIVANPETTLAPTEKPRTSSGLLSVIETVRSAAGAKAIPAGIERSKELMAVIGNVGAALLSQLSLDEVLDQIVGLVFEAIPADRAFLFLRETGEGGLVCKVASYRGREPAAAERTVKVSHSITQEVVGKGQSVLTTDALSDERFQEKESIVTSRIRSIMAVPLSVNKQVLGMIYVDSPMNINRFTDDDLRLLTTIASVAAIKIENTVLLEQRIENERIKQQLDSARDIQCRLLPVTPPALENYELVGISFPCFEVGGDYFDFIRLGDGQLGIALGDVSGKGIDAALLMSSLHASLRAQALTRAPIPEMIAAVNRYLYENTPPNKFVTLFYGELDPRTHRLTYTNAGHNPPTVVRADGRVENLEASGIPVGILGQTVYEERRILFEPGDLLLLYSDGISESTNETGEEFGLARLLEPVQKYHQLPASALRDRIDEALNQFVGKAPTADDMTLVIVKRVAD